MVNCQETAAFQERKEMAGAKKHDAASSALNNRTPKPPSPGGNQYPLMAKSCRGSLDL